MISSPHPLRPDAPTAIEMAAGGVVCRLRDGRTEVAIVRRCQYGDWVLPKGRFEPSKDRDLLACAVREVKEETGFHAEVIGYCGSIEYEKAGRPKIVLFWRMEGKGGISGAPNDEIQEVVWLEPEPAARALSYSRERELLRKVLNLAKPPTPTNSRRKRFFLRSILHDRVQLDRLDRAILSAREECQALIARNANYPEKAPHIKAIRSLIDNAMSASRQCDVNTGWNCLHAALRHCAYLLDPESIRAKASSLRAEAADKIHSWRRAAIVQLLDAGDKDRSLAASVLYEAMALRDEHSDNLYVRVALLRQQFGQLFLILVLVLALMAGLAVTIGLCSDSNDPLGISTAGLAYWTQGVGLITVLLFGTLGATFSALISTARLSAGAKIPEKIASYWVTLSRVFVGPVSALAIVLFLSTEIGSAIFNTSSANCPAVLFIAFASGFNEMLLVRTLRAS